MPEARDAAKEGAAAHDPAAPASLRRDVYVYNEATGFLVASRRMAGRGFDSRAPEWDAAVAAGDLIPVELHQDDPFIVRVLVNDEPSARELEESVCRLTWPLRVPDGCLAIAGGIDLVAAPWDDEVGKKFARFVEVPRGDYTATLYTYANSANGEACLGDASPGEAPALLGAWFRTTRASDHAFPPWIAHRCRARPEIDPGHEAEWRARTLGDEPQLVDFLLHLAPRASGEAKTEGEKAGFPPLSGGFFPSSCEPRRPARCPLGIEAREVEGLPRRAAPPAVSPIAVAARIRHLAPVPIAGGPVSLPFARLERLFLVPWFAHDRICPEIRVQLPAGATFALPGATVPGAALALDRGELRVGFGPARGRASNRLRVAAVAPLLEALPATSVLELSTSPADVASGPRPIGVTRFRGEVEAGSLRIVEAFPEVSAETLAAALALAQQVEGGAFLELASEEEAERVLVRTRKVSFAAGHNSVHRERQRLRLEKLDPADLLDVAAHAFAVRHAGTWPLLLDDAAVDRLPSRR